MTLTIMRRASRRSLVSWLHFNDGELVGRLLSSRLANICRLDRACGMATEYTIVQCCRLAQREQKRSAASAEISRRGLVASTRPGFGAGLGA